MKIEQIEGKIVRVVVGQDDYNLERYYDDLIFLESYGILTFGDTNFRVLKNFFVDNGYNPESLDLCLEDDESIGLEMPKTWYLNKGKHALSIAMYYNYLNFHGIVENKNLGTFNEKIAKEYGRIACIEVYQEEDLKLFLSLKKIDFFGTPRTLTECVRYLEGWSIQKYPRLKGYATFSKFIELWSRINFPHFNASEWYLGKGKSNQINKKGVTNVRKAIRYFWQNYLLKESCSISNEDIEVDILGGIKFCNIRQPKIILMSEDLFSEEDSEYEIFVNLTRKLSLKKKYISRQKNDFPKKNAKKARLIFPDALIILVENDDSFGRNFSLINPVKQALNMEVVVTAKILRYFLENGREY